MNRAPAIFFAAFLACVATMCQAQFSRPSTPFGGGPPVNPADPTGAASDVRPLDPAIERAQLKQRRFEAYRKMHSDARAMVQAAAELNAELAPPGDAAKKTDPNQVAREALSRARKIDKLAGEIDRLMRED